MYEKLMVNVSGRSCDVASKEIHKEDNDRTTSFGTEAKSYAHGATQKFAHLVSTNNALVALESMLINYPPYIYALEDGFGGEDDFSVDEGGTFGDTNTEDGGGDPFGTSNADTNSTSGDNPFDFGGSDDSGDNVFDFDGASDDGDNFFGSSDSEEKKEPQEEITLNRDEGLDNTYSMNRNVREIFPKRLIELKDSIKSNIDIIEKSIIYEDDSIEILDKILKEYEYLNNVIDEYLDGILERPYEDIFATYVQIHTSLMRLKKLYLKVIGKDGTETE